jgi:hypothetical protein
MDFQMPVPIPRMPPIKMVESPFMSSKQKRELAEEAEQQQWNQYHEACEQQRQRDVVSQMLSLQRKEEHLSREEEAMLRRLGVEARTGGYAIPKDMKWHRSDYTLVPKPEF